MYINRIVNHWTLSNCFDFVRKRHDKRVFVTFTSFSTESGFTSKNTKISYALKDSRIICKIQTIEQDLRRDLWARKKNKPKRTRTRLQHVYIIGKIETIQPTVYNVEISCRKKIHVDFAVDKLVRTETDMTVQRTIHGEIYSNYEPRTYYSEFRSTPASTIIFAHIMFQRNIYSVSARNYLFFFPCQSWPVSYGFTVQTNEIPLII